MPPAVPFIEQKNLCRYCHEKIKSTDVTANHNAFHALCFDSWIYDLYNELERSATTKVVPINKATA